MSDRPRIEPTLGPPTPLELLAQRPVPQPPPRTHWSLWLALVVVWASLIPPLMVAALRWLPPPTTAFMLQSPVKPVQYRWVPATRQADVLRKAVVAAEDQKFFEHQGFDFEAIDKAIEHNRRSRRVRGASTISQQVAKNLFLWGERSWVRKGLEVSFTVLIETFWTKPRILEMYLNIAEFGPGIYGVEAAAQKFFGVPAAKVTPEQAARLAAVLPRPRKWRAVAPGPYVLKRSQWILGQMGYRPIEAEPSVPSPDAEEIPVTETPQTPDTPEAMPETVAPDGLPEPESPEGPRRSYLTPLPQT